MDNTITVEKVPYALGDGWLGKVGSFTVVHTASETEARDYAAAWIEARDAIAARQ
jgi:hypothetical protein